MRLILMTFMLMAISVSGPLASKVEASTFHFVERINGTPGPDGIDGNDCSGFFGQGFSNCSYMNSPIVAKIEFNDSGASSGVELNTTVFGSGLTSDMVSASASGNSATFTYDTSSYGDGLGILLRYVVLKNGNGFDIWKADTPAFTFNDVTLTATTSNGMSHISFYDTLAPIPLPAAGWLMLAGLGGLAAMRRRKKTS